MKAHVLQELQEKQLLEGHQKCCPSGETCKNTQHAHYICYHYAILPAYPACSQKDIPQLNEHGNKASDNNMDCHASSGREADLNLDSFGTSTLFSGN